MIILHLNESYFKGFKNQDKSNSQQESIKKEGSVFHLVFLKNETKSQCPKFEYIFILIHKFWNRKSSSTLWEADPHWREENPAFTNGGVREKGVNSRAELAAHPICQPCRWLRGGSCSARGDALRWVSCSENWLAFTWQMGAAPYPKLQAKNCTALLSPHHTGNCTLVLFYFFPLLSSLHCSPKAFHPVVACATQEQDTLSSPPFPGTKGNLAC